MDLHLVSRAIGRDDPAEVRLVPADGHEGVASGGEGIRDEKVQLPRLVSPEAEPREVVSLAEDPAVRDLRQGRELMHWRRQHGVPLPRNPAQRLINSIHAP